MKKLLIVMDPEHRHQVALTRGIELARATGASLEVVAFVHEYLDAISDETATQETARTAITGQRQRWLEQVLALCDCSDLDISANTVWTKRIHEWIIDRCEKTSVDAVIKTGNRSETFLYTPTDWHLIRECPAPVMLVAENKWNKARPILAAVDLSSDKPVKKALNHRIIAQARQLADALGTDLHLVHALHTSVILADLDLVDTDARDRKRQAALKPQVEHLCHTWHLKPEHVHIASGPAQKVIPSTANRIKADMVVIGTSGKTGLAAMVIGNTAEKVLTHLRTDLLAIKPREAQ
ncbi:universal stress protein [Marinobacter bryozoorum]|jgi:universal stress protein E|uniref:universal stress protein n=1 Tax=Marinobacter bryozoorum TaxID=256324 RepID=UPI0020055968|nr:universal stress protein [Marinobacter bryozoorum]MCK7544570.1 universal stress protein [Marinobacter bryozoorum]